MNHEQK
jgi:hypothetical protein